MPLSNTIAPVSQSLPIGLGNEDMVTALRPIEVRTAAADAVPKVAAVLADAFINDPVFTWLLPGSLRRQTRLRTMVAAEMELYALPNGTMWTTSGYHGVVTELPPGAGEMRRVGERASARRAGDC